MSLDTVMERLGRVLAADPNLKVSIQGDRAYAEEGLLVLPTLDNFDCLEARDAERMLHGLIDHELGHVLDTDFEAIDELTPQSRLFRIWSTLEDGYIERRRGMALYGCQYNLAQKNKWFWETTFKGGTCIRETVGDTKSLQIKRLLVSLAMIVRPYGGVTLAEVIALAPDLAPKLRAVAHVLPKLEALASESKQTAAVIELAREVDRLWTTPEEEGGDPQQPEEEDCGGSSVSANAPLTEIGATSPEEMITELITQHYGRERGNNTTYQVFSHEWDIEIDLAGKLKGSVSDYERLHANVEATSEELTSTFEAALRDRQLRRLVASGDVSGYVDPMQLPGFSVGSLPVEDLWVDFLAEEEAGHAAVGILIDASGSMTPGVQLAQTCALAMSKALATVQVPFEVTGFSTAHTHSYVGDGWLAGFPKGQHMGRYLAARAAAEAKGTDLSIFARSGDTVPVYGVYKSFSNADLQGLTYIGANSGNLDGEAVRWQAKRLLQRPEKRKVMFVLSDGYPTSTTLIDGGAQYLRDMVRESQEAGIELHGIGIQSDAVRYFYPNYSLCEDLTQLPEIAMQALLQTMNIAC